MKNVLVVDDEVTDLMLVERSMRQSAPNLSVTTCLGGAEALQKIRSSETDIVLLDINMPEMDGFEMLKEARSATPRNLPAIIMFSTSAQEEDMRRAYNAGATAYIVKPSSLEGYTELARAISGFWGQHVARP